MTDKLWDMGVDTRLIRRIRQVGQWTYIAEIAL